MPVTALAPPIPTVLDALREATRSRHASISASPYMARLFDPSYSKAEYVSHLGRLLGLYEPLEARVAEAAAPGDPALSLTGAAALREDLAIMGRSAAEIAALDRCDQLPHITPEGLRGYTYVILGSRLGGKIIVERLRAVLGPGASYHFYGDGSLRSEDMWASFRVHLEAEGQKNIDPICDTAAGIFDAYAAWLLTPLTRDGN